MENISFLIWLLQVISFIYSYQRLEKYRALYNILAILVYWPHQEIFFSIQTTIFILQSLDLHQQCYYLSTLIYRLHHKMQFGPLQEVEVIALEELYSEKVKMLCIQFH